MMTAIAIEKTTLLKVENKDNKRKERDIGPWVMQHAAQEKKYNFYY